MKKVKRKHRKARQISVTGYYRIYVKCKKCKRKFAIDVFGEDRKEWWEKNKKNFVCLLCDLEANWAKGEINGK